MTNWKNIKANITPVAGRTWNENVPFDPPLGTVNERLLALYGGAGLSFTPGALTAPFPTVENASLLIDLPVDAPTSDLSTTVRYRPTGSGTWLTGFPLDVVEAGTNGSDSWTNRLAGSLFNLDPATEYEAEVTIIEVGQGSETLAVTFTTWDLSEMAEGSGTVRNATNDATLSSALSSSVAGDVVVMAAGTYSGFDVNRLGSINNPITIRGESGAIVNGDIGIYGRPYIRVDNLTVNGRIRLNGSNNCAIVNNTVNGQGASARDCIVAASRAERLYIAGNTCDGGNSYIEANFGGGTGEGVAVTGPGHVVENNTIRRCRDGVSLIEAGSRSDQYSIDFINNTIEETLDDAIELDYAEHNVRALRNTINTGFVAVSSSPSLGGPTYVIGNQAYNIAFLNLKPNVSTDGIHLYQNTMVKSGDAINEQTTTTIDNARFKNNLFLGTSPASWNGFSSGDGRVFTMNDLVEANADFDHNGYGGGGTSVFEGRFGATAWTNLAQLNAIEPNSIQVDYSVFAGAVAEVTDPTTLGAMPDLTPDLTGAAKDAGVLLPGINDNFVGTAPDLGAIEATDPLENIQTDLAHLWTLTEASGNRSDSIGTLTLTEQKQFGTGYIGLNNEIVGGPAGASFDDTENQCLGAYSVPDSEVESPQNADISWYGRNNLTTHGDDSITNLLFIGSGSGRFPNSTEVIVEVTNQGSLDLLIYRDSNTWTKLSSGNGTITLGQEFDWGFSFDQSEGANGTARLYVNGVLEDTQAIPSQPNNVVSKRVFIGSQGWDTLVDEREIDGSARQYAYWDRVVTGDEFTALNNGGSFSDDSVFLP